MQFSKLVMAAALLFASTEACKCVKGDEDVGATQDCCAQLGGNFVDGNDCQAGSISEKLSNFRSCCETHNGETSDCDYPTRKDRKRWELKVREINTAGAIMTVV